MEPTSEQELKQLLEEGKITEEEYRELLEAIRQKEAVQRPVETSQVPGVFKPRPVFGKAALILMIIGLLLLLAPILFNIISGLYSSASSNRGVFAIGICPFLFLGFPCLIFAFVYGIIGWKTPQGKIAAIGVPCLGLLLVPALVFCLFYFHAVSIPIQQTTTLRGDTKIHRIYPLDSLDGLMQPNMIVLDEDVFFNGGRSLRINANSTDQQTVCLIETGPVEISNRMIIYSAKIRTLNLKGKAYLEMWCSIPGKGEFFSRGLEQPITGTTDWTDVQIPFRLESGQDPDNIKLNMVIEGTGTVWIDDINLTSNLLD